MNVLLRVVLIGSGAAGAAVAQTVGASLQGTVHDPSGAVLPTAQVEIRNVETGATRVLTADGSGRWREPVLLPGEYELRVSATRFQTTLRKGIHLAGRPDPVVDLALQLGSTPSENTLAA